jgi:hypothetical protein
MDPYAGTFNIYAVTWGACGLCEIIAMPNFDLYPLLTADPGYISDVANYYQYLLILKEFEYRKKCVHDYQVAVAAGQVYAPPPYVPPGYPYY